MLYESVSSARRFFFFFSYYYTYKRDEWYRITALDEFRETALGNIRITAASIYPT